MDDEERGKLTGHKFLAAFVDFACRGMLGFGELAVCRLDISRLWLPTNTKVDGLQASSIWDGRIGANLDELVDNASVAYSGCKVQSCISRHVRSVDYLGHEPREAH